MLKKKIMLVLSLVLMVLPIVRANELAPIIACGIAISPTLAIGENAIDGFGGYDPDGSISTAVINWGDGSSNTVATSNWTKGPSNPCSYVPTVTFMAIFNHSYNTLGIFTVTETLIDNSGTSISNSWITSTLDPTGGGGGHVPLRI